MVTVLFAGCSNETIKDEYTKQEVEKVTFQEGLQTIEHRSDNMDRGKHDFMTDCHSELVVDPNVKEYNRGDVVFYVVPEKEDELTISRIVALPGESIEIKKGQVFIDGVKLKTFYGREYHTGQLVENSDNTMEKFQVPNEYVFVMGDNWWRSDHGKHFRPLAKETIKGKVVGYME